MLLFSVKLWYFISIINPKFMRYILIALSLVMLGSSCLAQPKIKNFDYDNKIEEDSNQKSRINKLKSVKYWAYQITDQTENNSIKKIIDSKFDLVVIDNSRSVQGMENYNNKSDIEKIKNSVGTILSNKIVLSYIDIGEAEDYRYYYKKGWKIGNPSFIIKEDPDGWSGNYPVAFWDEKWKSIVFDYLDKIIEDGYDGIYMDWIEANDDEDIEKLAKKQGRNSAKEMIKFINEIAKRARNKNPNFILVAQNSVELVQHTEYLKIIDGIAQEQVWFDGFADSKTGSTSEGDWPMPEEGDFGTQYYIKYLKKFLNAGLPVFTVDYAQKSENIKKINKNSRELGFKPYVSIRSLSKLSDLVK